MVWSVDRAAAWYAAQGAWKQGVNFIPSDAVNQIQMWQDYNATTVRRELQWAADLQYNALRVFLHDQLYTYEGDGFLDRVDEFLSTAHELGFSTILVLLEGIWDPEPQYTPGVSQPPPRSFVHNSRWLQSPGAAALANDTVLHTKVRPYVQAVVQRFGNDTERVLMLDLMDQPDNPNLLSYGDVGERVAETADAQGTEWEPSIKLDLIRQFIPRLLDWVQEADPYRQVPVTIADWHVEDLAGPLGVVQDELRQWYLNSSDVITFHHYGPDVMDKLQALQSQFPGRPVVLSSFMARDDGSTLNPIFGDLYARNVWAMNWGFVSGGIQTIWNSDSWNIRYVNLPEIWHHDILWPNGTAYDSDERDYLLSFRTMVDNSSPTSAGSAATWAPTAPPLPNATLAPSMDGSRIPASQPKTQPPMAQLDELSESWTGAKWAATCVTLVGILGLVAMVYTCCSWCTARRQRSRTASASSFQGTFQAVENAEDAELKEFA